jgi:hypothetical protein
VDTNGIITTAAGNGDIVRCEVLRYFEGTYYGDGGPATNAALNVPFGVAVDSVGNLFIADQQNHRVRKVDTNGIISTVAGIGPSCGYGFDSGDGGSATNAGLNAPQAVTLDRSGNLFIASGVVREVHFAGFPALTIDHFSESNAGAYQVIVVGPYGSATSTVASVTLAAEPQLKGTLSGQGQVILSFSGRPELPYDLQTTANLVSPINWRTVDTSLADSNGNWTFAITNHLTNFLRFYRLSLP